MKNVLYLWFPVAFAIIGMSLSIYVVAQQTLRLEANDPQIAMVEDATLSLKSGTQPSDIITEGDPADIANTLDTYLIVYDDAGRPVAGDGRLDGNLPTLPSGVFVSVRNNGKTRFTWQPKENVRSAVVIDHWQSSGSGGFVMAGRSLREVEDRTSHLLFLSALGCVGALALAFMGALLSVLMFQKP